MRGKSLKERSLSILKKEKDYVVTTIAILERKKLGMSIYDIATEMKLSERTVQRRISEAKSLKLFFPKRYYEAQRRLFMTSLLYVGQGVGGSDER
jgi:hypothetical protein